MRDAYHEELDSIGDGLVEMARLVGPRSDAPPTALLDADLKLAESVIAADEKVDDLQHDLEDRAIALLARQQPVATDLRIVVTVAADERRPGALRRPGPARGQAGPAALPGVGGPARPARHASWRWASSPQRLMAKAGRGDHHQGRRPRAPAGAGRRRAWTLLHRTLFQHLLDDRWKHGIETAVDVTLLGRYYERFADHAVSVAKRVVYLVTGRARGRPEPGNAWCHQHFLTSRGRASRRSRGGERRVPVQGSAASVGRCALLMRPATRAVHWSGAHPAPRG